MSCIRNKPNKSLWWSHDLVWTGLQAVFVKAEATLINMAVERLREPPEQDGREEPACGVCLTFFNQA